MPTPRAVVDTVVVYAGLAHPDRPFGQVIASWYGGVYDLVCTEPVMDEYREVLLDAAYLAANDNHIQTEEFFALLEIFAVHVEVPMDLSPIKIRDERDQIWLDAARAGQVDYLVTSDPDFLDDVELVRQMQDLGVSIAPPYIFLREVVRL